MCVELILPSESSQSALGTSTSSKTPEDCRSKDWEHLVGGSGFGGLVGRWGGRSGTRRGGQELLGRSMGAWKAVRTGLKAKQQ